MAAERLSRRRRSLCHDGVCRDEDVIHGVLAQADGYPFACVSVVWNELMKRRLHRVLCGL